MAWRGNGAAPGGVPPDMHTAADLLVPLLAIAAGIAVYMNRRPKSDDTEQHDT